MSLTTTYLVTTKNLDTFLNAIKTAQAPERFTQKFLQELDFSSSNDRLYIGVLKALNFIEESGQPTDRYYEFLDQSESGRVLADGIRDAYEDLFRINKNAQDMSEQEVKNKLKTLTRGEKSENVTGLMAKTFKALCEQADWTKSTKSPELTDKSTEDFDQLTPPVEELPKIPGDSGSPPPEIRLAPTGLHYNIQIHLPPTRDAAVYDAIFKSLREHLLK